MEEIQDELDIEMNFSNPGEHVGQAKRNNRFLGERIQACYQNLPYKAIPRIMIKHMCMNQAKNATVFPAKNGISAHYSPHTIITGQAIDFEKHCKFEFGTYVQAFVRSDNSLRARTIDAIYLTPGDNRQGGH